MPSFHTITDREGYRVLTDKIVSYRAGQQDFILGEPKPLVEAYTVTKSRHIFDMDIDEFELQLRGPSLQFNQTIINPVNDEGPTHEQIDASRVANGLNAIYSDGGDPNEDANG